MNEFIICFYETGSVTLYKGDGSEGKEFTFTKDTLIKVSEKEMFKWLELAHTETIRLSIYKAKMVCDIS